MQWSITQQPKAFRVFGLFAVISIIFFLYLWRWPTTPAFIPKIRTGNDQCTPEEWSSGRWERRPNPPQVHKPEDVYAASGFKGCASNREVEWHLANDHPDDYNWRGNVSSYEWVPGSACGDIPDDREAIVKSLVEQGGWLLIGGMFL